MTEPTPPRGAQPQPPVPGRDETRPFQAPQEAPPGAAQVPASRRGKVLVGTAAAGLLGVGVAVGVVVGQATAGTAAADTGTSTTQTVPGDGGPGRYGTPPDGGTGGMPGGRGDLTPPDGSTDDGATDDGATDEGDATT